MIRFPNLGIELEHMRSGISCFGFEITYFGILAGIGLLIMAGVTLWIASWSGQNLNEYANLILISTLGAIVGARVFYVIFQWTYYKDHIKEAFQIRSGGLSFYGAVLMGIFCILIYSVVRKQSMGRILDTGCIGTVAGQAVLTWGVFLNQEGFGEYTDGMFAMQIPLESVSASAVTESMKQHIVGIAGQRFIQVTPIFLLEFLWCILIVGILCFWSTRKKFDGELFLGYLVLYSIGRFWIEGMRTDALLLPGTSWKISQLMAGLTIVFSLLAMLYIWSQSDKARLRRMKEREARKFLKISGKRLYIK